MYLNSGIKKVLSTKVTKTVSPAEVAIAMTISPTEAIYPGINKYEVACRFYKGKFETFEIQIERNKKAFVNMHNKHYKPLPTNNDITREHNFRNVTYEVSADKQGLIVKFPTVFCIDKRYTYTCSGKFSDPNKEEVNLWSNSVVLTIKSCEWANVGQVLKEDEVYMSTFIEYNKTCETLSSITIYCEKGSMSPSKKRTLQYQAFNSNVTGKRFTLLYIIKLSYHCNHECMVKSPKGPCVKKSPTLYFSKTNENYSNNLIV